ncbi:MAG: CHAT domain-containing protein [Saprospiraceae bacterium]
MGNHSETLYTSRGASPVNSDISYNLYDLLWRPMEKYLLDVRKIYYAASGLFYRINLDAVNLPGSKEILASKYYLLQLGSTRQLVEPTSMNFASNNAILFGGLKFDFDSEKKVFDSTAKKSGTLQIQPEMAARSLINRGESWGFLPGTEKEVNEIEALLKKTGFNVTSVREYAGSEEVFKMIGQVSQSPRILHIATHGYFFPDPDRAHSAKSGVAHDSAISEGTAKAASNKPKLEFGTKESVFKISEHPMLRSGLIMSGGNAGWKGEKTLEGREDGVLTAYEISQMNLSNTELVVLSACETGLGEIQGNEGVYGLQRAFKIAGVMYIIMSLWQVPDKQTSMLMTTFYKKWLEEKMSIPDAFHAAQKNCAILDWILTSGLGLCWLNKN